MGNELGGLQGYSSPNGKHVIFCADAGFHDWCVGVMHALGVDFIEGTGYYKHVEEPCFAVDYDTFWTELYVKIKPGIEAQETFLILGTLKGMNWRKAELFWQQSGATEFMGTWLEVGDVRGLDGWSEFNGHYYAVKNNPPDCLEEVKERRETQMLFDLRMELFHTVKARANKAQGKLLAASYDMLIGKTLENGNVITPKVLSDAAQSR